MRSAACLSLLLVLQAIAGEEPGPLGKLVDIGGYRLHLYCTGRGRQTVLLSPGGGDFSFDWYLVQQRVSVFTRVCSYDRADSAWSDPGPQPRTMRQEAYDLNLALHRAKERGPYILVGHSLGGLVMRIFAERYPETAVGMVLVDATSPDTTLGYNGRLVHMRELAKARPIPEAQTMKTSPPRLINDEDRKKAIDSQKLAIHPPFDRLPADIQRLQVWAWSLPPKSSHGEDYLPEEMNELYQHSIATAHPLGDRPLVSIIAMRADPRPQDVSQEQWDALIREKIDQKRAYRGLSTNSKIIEDAIAGHSVHLDDPETVVIAIRDVINAAQRHTRLPP
jgi:pimeloyl-ACP methyl ester carboxylesterase